ncbi:MAG: MoaD/ThiS family protein [Promethearchaeati archaeon SRVP18_Atabeyarchaeia-1]
MAKVKLRLMGPFWFSTGVKELDIEGNTVNEVATKFVKRYKDKIPKPYFNEKTLELHPLTLILLNSSDVEFVPGKRNAKLKDGDVVAIAPPVSGG